MQHERKLRSLQIQSLNVSVQNMVFFASEMAMRDAREEIEYSGDAEDVSEANERLKRAKKMREVSFSCLHAFVESEWVEEEEKESQIEVECVRTCVRCVCPYMCAVCVVGCH